jgi:hypothetical protein
MLDDFLAWARQLEGAFTRLCAVPERVNEALDPDFVACFPYLSTVAPGDEIDLEVRVTNHGRDPAEAQVALIVPPGWSAVPVVGTEIVPADATVAIAFTIQVPAGETPGRRILVADLTLGERRYGQRAEAIVDVSGAA